MALGRLRRREVNGREGGQEDVWELRHLSGMVPTGSYRKRFGEEARDLNEKRWPRYAVVDAFGLQGARHGKIDEWENGPVHVDGQLERVSAMAMARWQERGRELRRRGGSAAC